MANGDVFMFAKVFELTKLSSIYIYKHFIGYYIYLLLLTLYNNFNVTQVFGFEYQYIHSEYWEIFYNKPERALCSIKYIRVHVRCMTI